MALPPGAKEGNPRNPWFELGADRPVAVELADAVVNTSSWVEEALVAVPALTASFDGFVELEAGLASCVETVMALSWYC